MDNYFIVQTGFILTTFVFFGLVLHMLNSGLSKTSFSPEKQRKIFRIALLSLICWMMFTGFLAAANFFNDFSTMPPKFFIVLIVPLVAVIYLSTRKSLTEILRHVPPSNIMFLQGFRIVVEILLWMLLSCLVSYLNLEEIETPCFTGKPDAKTYRDAILFVLNDRREPVFDPEPYLSSLC